MQRDSSFSTNGGSVTHECNNEEWKSQKMLRWWCCDCNTTTGGPESETWRSLYLHETVWPERKTIEVREPEGLDKVSESQLWISSKSEQTLKRLKLFWHGKRRWSIYNWWAYSASLIITENLSKLMPKKSSLCNSWREIKGKVQLDWRGSSFFESIKREIFQAPLLGMPTEQGMFVLDTDASVVAISGILHEEQEWIRRTVLRRAYGSKTYGSKKKSGAPKAEMFAVTT